MMPSVIVVSVTPLSVFTPPAPASPAGCWSAVLPQAASTSELASAAASAAALRPGIIVVPLGGVSPAGGGGCGCVGLGGAAAAGQATPDGGGAAGFEQHDEHDGGPVDERAEHDRR